MAIDVVVGVSYAHIGLGLLRLLDVGWERRRAEEPKSRDMKNPFMGNLDSAEPCQCLFRLALCLNKPKILPLFDDELLVLVALVALVSFQARCGGTADQYLFHFNGR